MTTENLTINFADFTGWEPYTGDGSAILLPQDGLFRARVTKFKTGTSGTGNKTVKLVLALAEDDGTAGVLYSDIAITGESTSGPNVKKFADFLHSAGQSREDIAKAASEKRSSSVADLVNEIINNKVMVYIDVQAQSWKGKVTSKVQNFVSPERFEAGQTAGTNRRPHGLTNSSGSNGVASTGGVATGAGAKAIENILGS